MLPALAAGFLSFPAAAHADTGCHSKQCVERVYRKQCWRGSVQGCIHRAAMHWRVSYTLMDEIIGCESGHDPSQVTPPFSASGLAQFLPSTWAGNRYGRHPILSAKWNSLGMAWLLSTKGLSPWYASRACWG